MKHKVKVTGILKKNGEMAHYGDILDANELISPNDSLDGGFTEIYKEKVEAPENKITNADDKATADAKAEEERLAQEAADKEAADKAAADQKIADDLAKEAADKKLAEDTGDGKSAADLLNAAKGK